MTLCHGPGCRNPQTVPYWCSESCSDRWNARWGKRLPSDQFDTGLAFQVVAEQQRIETAIAEQMPQPGDPVTWDELRERVLSLAPVQPSEPINLTREQFAAIPRAAPTGYLGQAMPGAAALLGVPVQLVDTPEESTLGAAYPQVASEEPQVAAERGWLSRAFGRMFGKGEQG
jgi:hypothetical protein